MGLISDIQKFSIHDGPGIRTLIFMKGCPLRCQWCSNPETQNHFNEIIFIRKNCVSCGDCLDICPIGAIEPKTFDINRHICDRCLKCVDICPANSKIDLGKWYTVPELINEVESDRIFYRNSDGGITVSGGEPLLQYKFVSTFLKKCQELNLNTAIETCGYAKWEHLESVAQYTNHVFFDIKHMNTKIHQTLTGKGNELILKNATKLDSISAITIRIPIIPGMNDSKDNIEATIKFSKNLNNLNKIELLPYHPLGENKYSWLDKQYKLKDISPMNKNKILKLKELIKSYGIKAEVRENLYIDE